MYVGLHRPDPWLSRCRSEPRALRVWTCSTRTDAFVTFLEVAWTRTFVLVPAGHFVRRDKLKGRTRYWHVTRGKVFQSSHTNPSSNHHFQNDVETTSCSRFSCSAARKRKKTFSSRSPKGEHLIASYEQVFTPHLSTCKLSGSPQSDPSGHPTWV